MRFISGLYNCHLPGLHSLVLEERKDSQIGMRRVFLTDASCNMSLFDGADFRLKPHNHRQSIRLTRLFGEAINWSVEPGTKEAPGESCAYRYRFGSALLNGKFELEQVSQEPYGIRLIARKITEAGIPLHWSQFHTVTAAPISAWLVEEFELGPEGAERCFSLNPQLKLVDDGLYREMSREQLAQFETIFDTLGVEIPQ